MRDACRARHVDALFQVTPSDPVMLAVPAATLFAATLLAAVPPVLRAARIDPVAMLRAD